MSKWIISWDAGYGNRNDTIEAETFDRAVERAYEEWKQEAESNSSYTAVPYTDELAEDYGL